MGILADGLDNMRVQASTPGGSINAQLHGRSDVYVSFAPGYYRRVDRGDLEAHLASLARLLWVARMREYYALLSDALGMQVTGESPAISPRDVEYERQRDGLRAEGRASDGSVTVSVVGMKTWKVSVSDHALNTLREEEFAARVGEAAGALIHDHRRQIRELKMRIYDPAFT
ncbi:hypothetical protein [Allorhizocola rhizosphaerae]|uniref:hypothetical protein n=1 Tax=Allorhizocola rhizosphaerae TaxID=1872709 RepID=UPI000E3B7075|nr:hypothetical protein [Allorhizocola rhizosphaerae]